MREPEIPPSSFETPRQVIEAVLVAFILGLIIIWLFS